MKIKDINLKIKVVEFEESTAQVRIYHPLFGYKWIDIEETKKYL